MDLHPRHGTHDPTESTPRRPAGSIRRTSNLDMTRPKGLTGPLHIEARSRDLATGSDGSSTTSFASMSAEVAFTDGRTLDALSTNPAEPALADLIGLAAASGFRSRLMGAVPEHRRARSLLYFLLDDVPTATLISGFAMGYAGHRPLRIGPKAERQLTPNLCAGWVPDGVMMTEALATGHTPVPTGPPALDILDDDDPLAWHEMEILPAHAVRRQRRIDVAPLDDMIGVSAMFRDSHMSPDGVHTVIHEYVVDATIDPATRLFANIAATPRVLPWFECPNAATSARRLIGTPVDDLRGRIAVDFTGETTCTHLNDLLRSMEDVATLASVVNAMAA
jgi:hypothetical protein